MHIQVTFIEALDQLMPGFDPEISKLAQRVLINPRKIDYHTGVFASKVFSCLFIFVQTHVKVTLIIFSPILNRSPQQKMEKQSLLSLLMPRQKN